MSRLRFPFRRFPPFLPLFFVLGTVFAQVPPPGLFDGGWDDRAVFLEDLVEGVRDRALALADAPVYHLELILTSALDLVNGRFELRYVNRGGEPLEELVFHLYPNLIGGRLEILDLRVDGEPADGELLEAGAALRLPLEPALEPGAAVVVAMDYVLEVPTVSERQYGILGFREDVLSLAHAYPQVAVRDERGWDVAPRAPYGDLGYAESGFYRVRVTAPRALELVAGGRRLERRRVPGTDADVHVFAAGPVRDFFLSAAAGYRVDSRRVGETTVRSYSLPGQRPGAREALEHAAEALALLGERYGPYPFRELDLVPMSTTALGMEFPGIVALATRVLEGSVPPGFLEGTTAHEVAHQWFYSAVGNDQAGEPWLDEALTQYATLLYFGDRYGPGGVQGFRGSLEDRWDRVDRAETPIGLPTEAYSDSEYASIVYGLGPLLLERLAQDLGEELFAAFLRDYVDTFLFDIARADDFRVLAEEHCGCDLGVFFATRVLPPQE